MGVGSVADIGEHVALAGEGLLAEPHRSLAAHMRDGGRLQRVHVHRHGVAADAGERAAAFRHAGRAVVRAAGAEAGIAHRRRPIAELFRRNCRLASAQSGLCSLSALNSTSAMSSGDASPKLGMAGAPCAGSNVAPSKNLPTMRGTFGPP